MLIWVIGKNGMLGSYFCKALKKEKIPFFSTSHKQVDITKNALIKQCIAKRKPTHIINCAAYTNVEKAEEEKEKAYSLNCDGIVNLARAAKSCKLIHFSTDYVFDGTKQDPYLEEDQTNPINVYGKSKLAGERLLLEIKPDALVFRISWLYGKKGDFVSKMLHLFKKKETLSVVADQIGCPTYAKDVVTSVLSMLDAEGLYHYVQEETCSWYIFAKKILEYESHVNMVLCKSIEPVLTINYQTKARRPLYSVLGSSKIQSHIKKTRPWFVALKEYLHG